MRVLAIVMLTACGGATVAPVSVVRVDDEEASHIEPPPGQTGLPGAAQPVHAAPGCDDPLGPEPEGEPRSVCVGVPLPKAESPGACCYPAVDLYQRIIATKRPEWRGCYVQALARDPKAKGRVSARFEIGPAGHVSQACAVGHVDDALLSCVAAVFTTLKFPAVDPTLPCAKVTTVSYPVVFRPSCQST